MRRKPRAYLSVLQSRITTPSSRSLAEAIEEAGFEIISRWILVWELGLKPELRYVFKRDIRR